MIGGIIINLKHYLETFHQGIYQKKMQPFLRDYGVPFLTGYGFSGIIFLLGFILMVFIKSHYTSEIDYLFCVIFLLILFLLLMLGLSLRSRKKPLSKAQNKKIVHIILLIGIVLQCSVALVIEMEYHSIKNSYSQQYISFLGNGDDELNATWKTANLYYNNTFSSSYSKENALVPSRELTTPEGVITLLFNPVLMLYFIIEPIDGFSKLTITQRNGACGEFASDMNLLLEDITGFETRIINMQGHDHALPEIKINGIWWVFDRAWTTEYEPIKTCDYASYLFQKKNYLFEEISNLEDRSHTSLLTEHGFESSNLTITAKKNTLDKEWDDKLIKDATVEIFICDNTNDPLVCSGVTDENGNFSVNLKKNKNYLVLIKGKDSATMNLVAIKEVKPSSNIEHIVVDLKYAK
ncbi:TPA: hypothetical protein HA351_12280 [Methanosarcinaceae archaeon]|nr:hypothetical protein [Methanosarcinaceae archaeon]